VIVINLFFNYAISLVYDAPQYDEYCKQEQVIKEITNQKTCVDTGGQWNANISGLEADGEISQPAELRVVKGYCDQQFKCRTEFEADRKVYERNVFVTLTVLGIVLVGASFALVFNWILSVSASMGGILSIIIASIRYWAEADNWLRVVILFVALCVLIYFAAKKFKN
jgi:hypothetical protein